MENQPCSSKTLTKNSPQNHNKNSNSITNPEKPTTTGEHTKGTLLDLEPNVKNRKTNIRNKIQEENEEYSPSITIKDNTLDDYTEGTLFRTVNNRNKEIMFHETSQTVTPVLPQQSTKLIMITHQELCLKTKIKNMTTKVKTIKTLTIKLRKITWTQRN